MRLTVYSIFGALFLLYPAAECAVTIKNGQFIDADCAATTSVKGHYDLGLIALDNQQWREAARNFRVITTNFPSSEYVGESWYYLGVAEYYEGEYDAANEALQQYLKVENNPEFFQETIEYKFHIAQKLAGGGKRRFLGTKKLPKWASGDSLALEIFDEVIAAVPCHDIAAQALFSKGALLKQMNLFKDSIDAYQTVIRRFPKHELAPESYVAISKVYLAQSKAEFQNPDILAFAQLNLKRFELEFPREERIGEVEKDLLAIKEIYANGLYETGQFYERTKKVKAAVLYYKKSIKQFPDTKVADKCKERLIALRAKHPEAIELKND